MFKACKLLFYIFLLSGGAYADESSSNDSGSKGKSWEKSKPNKSDSFDSGSKPQGKKASDEKRCATDLTTCYSTGPICECELTETLRNLANGSDLTECEKLDLLKIIDELELDLADGSLDDRKRVCKASSKLKKFFKGKKDFEKKLNYKKVKRNGGNKFFLKDLHKVCKSFGDETAGYMINLSGNNCPLFDALRGAAQGCASAVSTATAAATTAATTSSCSNDLSTGSTPTGATATGSTDNGATGSTVTGSAGTESTATGATVTGSTGTAGTETTGTAVTGSTATGSSGTGSAGTDSTVSGSTATAITAATSLSTGSVQTNCSGIDVNIEILIQKLLVILQGSGTTSQLLSLCYVEIQKFFVDFPQYQIILEFEATGYFSLDIFFEVTLTHNQAESGSLENMLTGDFTTCPLLLALEKASKDMSLSVEIRAQITALYDELRIYFDTEVSVELRLEFFSLQYYQFCKDFSKGPNPLASILDELEIDGFGSIEQAIYISAIIKFPSVDYSQIDMLINATAAGGWNNTVLIQSFHQSNANLNKTYYFHGYFWINTQWILFRNTYLNNNISLIIVDTSLTYKQKHIKICAVLQKFISIYSNKQFFYCMPLGDTGLTLADYQAYTGASPKWTCEIPRQCLKDRNDLIKKKPDGSCDVTKGFDEFMATLDSSEASQVQPYYDQIKAIVGGPAPSGGLGQQVSQIVDILKSLKASVPSCSSATTVAGSTVSGATGSTGASSTTAASSGSSATGTAVTGSSAAATTGASSAGSTGATTPGTDGTTAAPCLGDKIDTILFGKWGRLAKFIACQGPEGTKKNYPTK